MWYVGFIVQVIPLYLIFLLYSNIRDAWRYPLAVEQNRRRNPRIAPDAGMDAAEVAGLDLS